MVNIIKAIAKGAAAALAAALPGGKTPQEEFARVYAEVMKGGEGKESTETEATFDRGGMAAVEDLQAGNETGDGAAAESFYAKKREEEKFDKDYMDSLPKNMSESSKENVFRDKEKRYEKLG